jgi:drug/metabolite transporter (DMT)-like permease
VNRLGVEKRTGILLLIAITVFWGVNWPAMKLAVAAIPVWTFRSICLVIGGFGLLGIARLARLPLRIPQGELGPLLVTAFFNITVWHVTSAAGLTQLAAGRAAILAFTMPLWATLIAIPLLGERLTALRAAGLGIGLAGLAVLLLPDWENVVGQPLGIVYLLVAAFAWAVGTVCIKYFRWTMPATVLAGWQILLGGIPVLLGMLIFDRGFDPTSVPLAAWMPALYAAIVPMLFCQWAWFKIVATFPAQVATVGTLAIPVIGVASSSLALGEPIGLDILAALLLEVAALALVLIRPARRAEAIPGEPV